MIVLLWSYSTSWCQSNFNDSILLTGEEMQTDSVLVPISALRVANTKMIELQYEKEINKNLQYIIQNDSLLIDDVSTNLSACEVEYNEKDAEVKEMKKQRNIAIGAGSCTSLLFLILLIIAL